MLRILHVDTERTWRGGEGQLLALASGLERHGHHNVLACPPGSALEGRARAAGLEVLSLPMRGEADLRAAAALRRFARERGMQVLHAHTAHAHSLVSWAGRGGLAARVVSRRVDFSPRSGWLGLGRLKYRWGVERFIAISRAIKEVLVASGVDPRRVTVVPSGVDPERCAGTDGKPAGLLVGSIGHLAWHKGFDVLIEAAALLAKRVPGVQVVVQGEGEERAKLESAVERLGLRDVVSLPGFSENTCGLFKRADVYVAPSLMEGLNTSLAEAMAARCPVVGSRVGGIPELVLDGVTGLLVPPKDPEALAGAIEQLLQDRPRAEALGEAARRHVQEHFSVDAMVSGNLAVYEELVGASCAARESASNL